MIFPTREIIVEHNRIIIDSTIGFFVPPENLLNSDGLEWVLEIIQYPLFGINPYPTLVEKAAILVWTIINDHVFIDGNNGNKRTAMFIMETFLNMNGFSLESTTTEMVKIALNIANYRKDSFTFDDLTTWIRNGLRYYSNLNIVFWP